MAKFVDKQNLLQYRYFNNMIGKDGMVKDIVSDYIGGGYGLSTPSVQNDPTARRDSLQMLKRGKRNLPAALYSRKEDQEHCCNEIFYGGTQTTRQNTNRYMDMLLNLHLFQGDHIQRNVEVHPEILEKLTEREKRKRYECREDGKFYSSFFSVPKLVLINKELFAQHLERDMTDEDLGLLEEMLPRDVHYILNVQSEAQSGYAYMIEKEGCVYIQRLSRYDLTDRLQLGGGNILEPEMISVALCLTDYLMEMENLSRQQKRDLREAGTGNGGCAGRCRVPKYVDQNSIKIFDVSPAAGEGDRELEVNYFRKRHASAGRVRKTGYEMAPHTRRGHYRTYSDGRTVYVRSAIIHKEKYNGIQSAHRINEKGEDSLAQKDTDGSAFTMGMQT